MLILLLFLSTLHLAYSSCPDGFSLVKDGECRGFSQNIDSYWDTLLQDTITKCNAYQGQPIIIHSQEQQSYWVGRLTPGYYSAIGLKCNTTTKKWEWIDGSPLDYKPPSANSALITNCVTGGSWSLAPNNQNWYFNQNHNSLASNVYCTTQLQQPAHSDDGCDQFEIESDDGVCYQIGMTALNYQDAQMICRERGANLASIHSLQENSFVRRLAVSKGKVDNVYLGATLSEKSGKFKWTDGSKWDYDNFYTGFPVAGLGDCLAMDTDGTSGQWANVDCSSKASVACMRPQNYSEPLICPPGPWTEGELIHSPGFPFDASTSCDYILSVEAGKRVQVEILLLEANSYSDKLIIFESYMGGTVIASLSGEIKDELYNTTASNYARVSWQPYGGVNVRGMLMTFRAVD